MIVVLIRLLYGVFKMIDFYDHNKVFNVFQSRDQNNGYYMLVKYNKRGVIKGIYIPKNVSIKTYIDIHYHFTCILICIGGLYSNCIGTYMSSIKDNIIPELQTSLKEVNMDIDSFLSIIETYISIVNLINEDDIEDKESIDYRVYIQLKLFYSKKEKNIALHNLLCNSYYGSEYKNIQCE